MNTATIPLTQGKTALVDAEDVARVSHYNWHVCKRSPQWYAATSAERRRGRVIYLHRLIIGAKPGEHVDHINGDGLDNRRANLRICTNAENRRNMRVVRGVSKFKGVAKCKSSPGRPWEAYIWFENRKIGLGQYPTQTEAARAYNAAAIELHCEFACINQIEGLTHEEMVTAPVRNRKLGRPPRSHRS